MEWLVIASCGAVVAMLTLLHDRKEIAALEDKIREIRVALAAHFPYRLPTKADADLVAMLGNAHVNALAQDGFTLLGDLIMEVPSRPPISIMRAFVDAYGTTVVYISAYPREPGVTYMLLESYTADAEYITHVGNPVRASAPFSHQQSVQGPLSIHQIHALHRTFLGGTPIVIASLDDLVRALRANHALFVAWRESLSPEDLLEIDLKTVLGAQYAIHGASWKRRLALRLPAATLRKKR